MSNNLPHEKRVLILRCLLEGMGINPTARVVGCHRSAVFKLLRDAGTISAQYQDLYLRDLPCQYLEVDEIWSFVYAKDKNVARSNAMPPYAGDVWLWVAFCRDTKLVPSWRIGDRTAETGKDFMLDLKGRLANRVQLTTDGHRAYLEAVEEAFGCDIDYAMLQKVYSKDELDLKAERITGEPKLDFISTSGVERQNLTIRMSLRRFTRRTNGFSKKLVNHAHSIALHYMHYNFCRIHQSIKQTPAMAAKVTDTLHDIDWIVELVADAQPEPRRPRTYQKRTETI